MGMEMGIVMACIQCDTACSKNISLDHIVDLHHCVCHTPNTIQYCSFYIGIVIATPIGPAAVHGDGDGDGDGDGNGDGDRDGRGHGGWG